MRLSPLLHPRPGDLGHAGDHERVAQTLWLLTVLAVLLILNIVALWMVVAT